MKSKNFAAWLGAALLSLASTSFSQTWQQLPGTANDVGVGPNGDAWVIGNDKAGNDYGIYKWNNGSWVKVPGGAVRIDVGPSGPWVVNSSGGIYRYNGSGWDQIPGGAKDIGIGANGTVWVIGGNPEGGGYDIYRYNGSRWDKIPGSAVRIDVDPQGNAWVVTSGNAIFRWNGSAFVNVPGAAIDIGIGANGTVYVVGTDGGVYRWDGGTWVRVPGTLSSISVDQYGNPWGVNAGKQVFASSNSPAPRPDPTVAAATSLNTNVLKVGDTLKVNQYLVSANGRFSVAMQNDGQFCIYSGRMGAKQWCGGTAGGVAEYALKVQADGNICVGKGAQYKDNTWCGASYPRTTKEAFSARIEDNGNFVVWSGPPRGSMSVWSSRYGLVPSSYQGTVVVRNMWREASAWVTVYVQDRIAVAECVEAGMTGGWKNTNFNQAPGSIKVRTELMRGTDGRGGDCSAGKFCDTNMRHAKDDDHVRVHQNARTATNCYLSYRDEQDVHSRTVQNMYNDKAVWVTFYKPQFLGSEIFESGCVPALGSKEFIHDLFQGNPFTIRAEVMTSSDCKGTKVCDTRANPDYPNDTKTQKVFPNGSNCYIGW